MLTPPCQGRLLGKEGGGCWPLQLFVAVADPAAVLLLAATAVRAALASRAASPIRCWPLWLSSGWRAAVAVAGWAVIETALLHSPVWEAFVPLVLRPPPPLFGGPSAAGLIGAPGTVTWPALWTDHHVRPHTWPLIPASLLPLIRVILIVPSSYSSASCYSSSSSSSWL